MKKRHAATLILALSLLSGCSGISQWDSAYGGMQYGEIIDYEAD